LPLDGAILGISRAPLSCSKGGVGIASGTPTADDEQPRGMEGRVKYDLLLAGGDVLDPAERLFPVHIRIALPPEGLGSRLDNMIVWLDANCGSDGWISMPSRAREAS
jgi:hypothetical protein